MRETIEFAKLSGSGNDFICIDNRDGAFDEIVTSPERVSLFARQLCHRGAGVGADGVIFAVQPEIEEGCDLSARFFEADGTEAELCGNGTGCFVHWASDNQWAPTIELRILTPAGVVRGKNRDNSYVQVCIPNPEDIQTNLSVEVHGRLWSCDVARVGVAHLATYVDDVAEVDVAYWGYSEPPWSRSMKPGARRPSSPRRSNW